MVFSDYFFDFGNFNYIFYIAYDLLTKNQKI